jgi:hypothetical protein
MGMETYGRVWFGYSWGGECRYGLPEPVVERIKPLDESVVYQEVLRLLGPFTARLVHYGYDHQSHHYGLTMVESVFSAPFGKAIEVTTLRVRPNWETQLKQAAETIGWPVSGPPRWWLTSSLFE